MELNGIWFGVMQDVQGIEGEVALTLPTTVKGQGEFALRFFTSSKPPLAVSAMELEQKLEEGAELRADMLAGAEFGGVLEIAQEEDKVILDFKMPEPVEKLPAALRFEGKIVDADPYARSAIFGCYEILEGPADAHFKGGYCVFWQFGSGKEK